MAASAKISFLRDLMFEGLGLKLLALAAMATALYVLGLLVELPQAPAHGLMAQYGRPSDWPRFTWLLAPLGLCLLCVICHLCAAWLRGLAQDQTPFLKYARQAQRLAWFSFLAWPLWCLCLIWHQDFDWAVTYGAIMVAALAWLAFVTARVLWQAASLDRPAGEALLCWGSVMLAFAVFAALALWTIQAVSTAGDETRYLIDADRLLHHLGLSQAPALEARPRQEFYWGRWSHFLGLPLSQVPWTTIVLAPGVWLAGRPGALWVLCAAGAACLWFVYSIGRSMGLGRRPVLAVCWALGASAPFVQMTQHIYPGALGMLCVSLALWLLLKPSGRVWLRLGGLAAVAVLMPLMKFRLVFTSLGLLLAGLFAWLRSRGLARLAKYLALALALAAGLLVLGLVIEATIWPRLDLWRKLAHYSWNMYPDWGRIAVTLPAMFLDQEYGLLFYAPWLGLAFIGVWPLIRQAPQAAGYGMLVSAFTVAPLVLFRWQQWDGGFTPPARFLAPLLPILAIWALPLFSRAVKGLVLAAISALLAWSLAISMVLAVMPQWRYHRGAAVNNLLGQLGGWLDMELARFFPSFFSFRGPDMAISLIWLAGLAVIGFVWWRGQKVAGADKAQGSGKAVLIGVTAALALLVGFGLAGRLLPSSNLEAEGLTRKGGVLFGSYYTEPKLFLLNRPGDELSGRVTWGANSRRLVIEAFHVEVDKKTGARHQSPVILVGLGSAPPQRLVVDSLKPKLYALNMQLPPGRHDLRIQYLWHHGRDQVALDRIMVR